MLPRSPDNGSLLTLVAVRVTEDDAGEGRTTSGVVDDLLYETTDESIALGKVEVSETRRGDTVVLVGC